MENHHEGGPENADQEIPKHSFMITRHVERTPLGDLTPDGLQVATEKGQAIEAEVLKGYSSKEESRRAFLTLEQMSKASGIKSELTKEPYKTKEKKGLFYSISGPLMPRIKEMTKRIDEAVKRDHPDYNPKEAKWAKIRAEYQPIGVKEIMADKEISHIFAMGLAAQFDLSTRLSNEYVKKRQSAIERGQQGAKPIEKNIALNIGTHGGFMEALLHKAIIRKSPDGEEKRGFEVSRDERGDVQFEKAMGNIFQPGESIKTGYQVGQETPERLPIEFEQSRFQGEECSIDMSRVRLLSEQFKIYLERFEQWEKEPTGDNEKALMTTVHELMQQFEEPEEKEG